MPPTMKTPRTNGSTTTPNEVTMGQLLQRMESMVETMTDRLNDQATQHAETRNLLTLALQKVAELESRLLSMQQSQPQPQQPLLQQVHSVEDLSTAASKYANKKVEKVSEPPKASFAAAAAKAATIVPRTKGTRTKRPIPLARAIRLFTPPSPTTGYQFVYLAQKGRVPMNEIRRSLSAIGVNNSRVLDIRFPTRNVCGLLVHNDFVAPLTKALIANGIDVKPDFNPTAGSILKDPKYNGMPQTEREIKAMDIYKNRILRIIQRSPLRVRTPLLTSFQNSGIITRDDWNNFSSHPTKTQSNNTHVIFPSDEADMDEDIPSHDTATHQ